MEIRAIYLLFAGFLVLSVVTVSGFVLYAQLQSKRSPSTPLQTEQTVAAVSSQAPAESPDATTSELTSEPPQVLGSQTAPAPASGDAEFRERLYSLINALRKESGVSPLQPSKLLEISASAKLSDMQQRKYWTHVSPEGTPPWDFFTAAGYDYLFAGENLSTGHDTPWNVFSNWQESPTHRTEMIKPEYTQMGVALNCDYQAGSNRSCVVVLHLGKPR